MQSNKNSSFFYSHGMELKLFKLQACYFIKSNLTLLPNYFGHKSNQLNNTMRSNVIKQQWTKISNVTFCKVQAEMFVNF